MLLTRCSHRSPCRHSYALAGILNNAPRRREIVRRDHDTPRQDAERALHNARMGIEDEGLDARLAQAVLQIGNEDDIVGSNQLFHIAESPFTAWSRAGSGIAATLAAGVRPSYAAKEANTVRECIFLDGISQE